MMWQVKHVDVVNAAYSVCEVDSYLMTPNPFLFPLLNFIKLESNCVTALLESVLFVLLG